MTLHVVVGGQYGSEGKGAIAAHLTHPDRFVGAAVRVAGPNAGHTAIDPKGERWPLRCIPVAAVVNPDTRLVLAAGSEIDPEVLYYEIEALEKAGYPIADRLYIDLNATVLTPEHRIREEVDGIAARSGSTGKGIGAARADRVMRVASTVRQRMSTFIGCGTLIDTASYLNSKLMLREDVLIEGTQGYGLGVHTGYYPHTTSQDCRTIDFLAAAGISPWSVPRQDLQIWVVVRPNPIRIAGNSGPLRDETTWEQLGLPQEQTTVTKKTRRVGAWDPDLVSAAVQANGGRVNGVHLALTMADHLDLAVAGSTDREDLFGSPVVSEFLRQVWQQIGMRVSLVGTSDRTVIDLRDPLDPPRWPNNI